MADPLKATKASKALRVSLPATASTSFQQVPQDRQNQRELKTSAIPQYRPYGSLGQDGRYQNGEFLSGPRSQPNQTNSQGLQAARSNQANLGQHSQKNLTGQSSRDGGPTAQNQQKQEIPDFNDNGEREPDPGFLASCDYHSFLNDTANTQTSLTPSSTVVTQAKTTTSQQLVDADVDCRDFGAASTAIKDRFAKESRSVLKKTKFPFKTLSYQPSRSLRERRSEFLRDRFTSRESSRIPRPSSQDSIQTIRNKRSSFLREPAQESVSDNYFGTTGRKFGALSSKISKSDLSRLVTPKKEECHIPTSSTTPTATRSTAKTLTVRPSPTTATRLDQRAAPLPQPSPLGSLGSLGSLSWKYSRREDTVQIQGTLPRRKSPPTKPPPKPPLRLKKDSLKTNGSKPIMSDGATEGELQKPHNPSLTLATKTLPEPSFNSEQCSVSSVSIASTPKDARDSDVKSKGPSLRNKVSKLFGDERNSRTSDTSIPSKSISAYRPISLTSHDGSNGASFSEIFDEVYNAAHGSFHSTGDYRASADVSTHSEHPSVSALSQEVSVAFSKAGNLSTSAAFPEAASIVSAGHSRGSTNAPAGPAGPAIQGPTAKDESSRQLSRHGSAENTSESATSREDLADQLASRLGLTDPAARAQILAAFTKIAPPQLHEHPAIRGDLQLQIDVGLLKDKTADLASSAAPNGVTSGTEVYPNPAATVHVPPLNVSRHSSAQIAGANKKTPQSKAAALQMSPGFTTRYLVQAHDMAKDLVTPTPTDSYPAFDRTVDLTWYRYTQLLEGHRRRVHQPQLARIFGSVLSMFVAKYARGVENWAKYDQPSYKCRFRYFDLDPSIRFHIMQKLLESYLPQKFVLLNGKRQAAPAWPANEFATLWDVLGPLQNYLTACPRLRADVMVTVLISQPFHAIFSPFVKPNTQPLPTKWLFNYAQYMQNVRVEVDLTKLGFGPTWDSTSMSTKLREIGNLVWVFAEEMEKRDPETNPMTLLTIYCRRYFGYRQGRNPFEGNLDMYRFPLIGGEEEGHGPKVNKGLPRYYGRPSASLPPSANHPYSKSRLHHTPGPNRVPYLHEGHMSVFHPFRRLQGRVWIVRMVGLSEKWVRDYHSAWWPKEEFDAIPDEIKLNHMDRCTPTDFTYVAHNHAIFVDGGIRHGLQRIPTLPEKKKRTCIYDKENDVFLENGTCNVLTVMENGVEMIPRADTRSMRRSELSATGEPDDPIELPDQDVKTPPKTPATAGPDKNHDRNMETVRKSTHSKAAKVLGVEFPAHISPVDSATSSSAEDTDVRSNEEAMPPPPPKPTSSVSDNDRKADWSMDTMRKTTNRKASKVLGMALPKDAHADFAASTSSSPEDTEDDLVTPIQSRAASNTSLAQQRPPVPSRAGSNTSMGQSQRQMSFMTDGSDRSEQNSRTSSVQGRRPRALSTKKSLMSLLSRDSKKGNKASK